MTKTFYTVGLKGSNSHGTRGVVFFKNGNPSANAMLKEMLEVDAIQFNKTLKALMIKDDSL